MWLVVAALLATLAIAIGWLITRDRGFSAVWILAPIVIAGSPLVIPAVRHWATVGAAVLMLGFCFVTGFSIGLFYWPSAAMLIAAARINAGNGSKPAPRPDRARRSSVIWVREFYGGLLFGLGLFCIAAGLFSLHNLADDRGTPAWAYLGFVLFWGLSSFGFIHGARSVRRRT